MADPRALFTAARLDGGTDADDAMDVVDLGSPKLPRIDISSTPTTGFPDGTCAMFH
jgi:hypothetical protein